jgi:prephenate dehydrogenase
MVEMTIVPEAPLKAASISRAVIVGGAGEVGRMIGRVLGPSVEVLEVVDEASEPRRAGSSPWSYHRSDAYRWVLDEAGLVAAADCVVLAVPEDVALRLLSPLGARMRAGALLVDTLSVKERVVAGMESLPPSLEKLSLNPMFAPTLPMRDQPVLAVEVGPGPRSRQLLGLLRMVGADVRCCDASLHDRATAALQVLTHAAILGFGGALAELGEDLDQLLPIAPPPFLALAALLARVLTGSPETYFDIQAANGRALRTREALSRSERELDLAVAGGAEEFEALLSPMREMLGARAPELALQAQRVLEAVCEGRGAADGRAG